MSDNQEHISHYSAADIQRYVQGKLSAREMHAMEKAALDDPFLADAIEGMQQAFAEHDENLVTGQLQELQQQFQTRTTSARKVVAFRPFRYWQAAAAAVVMIITGVWVYSLLTNSESPEKVIAKTEEHSDKTVPKAEEPKPQQQTSALADGNDITLNTDSITVSTTPKTKQKPAANAASGTLYRDLQKDEAVSQSAPPSDAVVRARRQTDSIKQGNNNRYDDSKPAAGELASAKQESVVPVAPAASPELKKAQRDVSTFNAPRERETELITIARNDSFNKKGKAVDRNKNNLSGFVKGQVTDHKNNPIANAYLQIPNTNNNFYTDKTGFFKIPVTDSVVDVAVNVSGYGTQNFRLQSNAAMNQLQLQPANVALNEVEVTPIKEKKLANNRNIVPSVMVHDAQPVFGWVAFEQYLEKNKIIPANAPALSGNVLVSFQVNKKGTLSDFKIEQSLSKAYDDEAIRLIMQGPSWKLLKGRKARVTVMVRF
jgi:hypothetical protein